MTEERRGPDLTGAVYPALSTTSDIPKVMPTVDAPKAQPAKSTQPKGAVSEEETAEARNRQREAKAQRAQALDERLGRALSALEKPATRTDTKVTTQPADPRPRRRDFDDPDSYEDELVRWSAKSAAHLTQAELEKQAKEREASETKSRTEREQQKQMQGRMSAWKSAKDKALEKYPDFEDIAEAADVPITPAMAISILEENLESGQGYEIAYYLGQHKKEAGKIAALPQHRQQLAIGRLAERLASSAPPKPAGSRAGAIKKSADNESMEEYAARRNAELRANH